MNKIKELRKASGWSLQRLADECRGAATASQISKIERGETRLNVEWMNRISDALQCHPTDLLDGGPPAQNAGVRKVVDKYLGMSERDRETWVRMADAFETETPPPENDDYEGPERRIFDDPAYKGPERRRETGC